MNASWRRFCFVSIKLLVFVYSCIFNETKYTLYSLSLSLSLSPNRSQRDVSGEKERRLQELHDHEERLRRVEAEITTANNDKNQFHNAAQRSADALKDEQ